LVLRSSQKFVSQQKQAKEKLLEVKINKNLGDKKDLRNCNLLENGIKNDKSCEASLCGLKKQKESR
jgi:hypothetical protein